MATVDVLKLGLALPLGYLAAKLAPSDPAAATTAATVAASLIGGAAGNFAHQALDAPTSALLTRVFKADTGLNENHTILLALRGAHLDALAEVAERAAKRLSGGDRDAGFRSYRAGLDGYLGAARQKLTPAGFAGPSDAVPPAVSRWHWRSHDGLPPPAVSRPSTPGCQPKSNDSSPPPVRSAKPPSPQPSGSP